ncbi:MAG: B12-binding domain-containing radical SAM protein [Desulfatitalea sp.]|nr:B12-binding domain-containing radical SAM protein [Desulfatitalea sp.]
MKVTFIMPSIGKWEGQKGYVKTWLMEPLSIAMLSALTPDHIEKEFFDDRFDEIDFNTKTDLVAITVETYTARRSYEIAKIFRGRGIKVVMGGVHATLNPEEIKDYADVAVLGEAENLWPDLLRDAEKNDLKMVYKNDHRPSLQGIFPDREILKSRKYLDIGLIETGRGCTFKCDFCSIAPFYNFSYNYRPIEDVIHEIKETRRKIYFFVDDNIASNGKHAKSLFRALIPLKIKWISQGSVNMANDPEMLRLMKESGCLGVLIGFESLNPKSLEKMNKGVNRNVNLSDAVSKIHGAGLKIYATFVFGYDTDEPEAFEKTARFAQKHGFFISAFNHMVPFPGTNFFKRLNKEGRIPDEKWWLDHQYTFGKVSFVPKHFTIEELTRMSYNFRKNFYSIRSIINRLFRFKVNSSHAGLFLLVNLLSKIDVSKRQKLPMGKGWGY